jgi:hypothetical protein
MRSYLPAAIVPHFAAADSSHGAARFNMHPVTLRNEDFNCDLLTLLRIRGEMNYPEALAVPLAVRS